MKISIKTVTSSAAEMRSAAGDDFFAESEADGHMGGPIIRCASFGIPQVSDQSIF